MTVFSGFYTWNTGDTITAARLNTINTVVSTNGNAIDNTNIGSAGIFLSQLKGTSGANNTFGISTTGATLPVPLIFGATAITDNTSVEIRNDNAGTNGLFLNVPTGSTNGVRFGVNGAAVAQITADGAGIFTYHGAAASSYVPPCYTAAGAALANTLHGVFGTATFPAAQSVTVTLSNSAVFTSGSTYVTYVCSGAGALQKAFCVLNQTATQFQIFTADSSTNSSTVNWFAFGT